MEKLILIKKNTKVKGYFSSIFRKFVCLFTFFIRIILNLVKKKKKSLKDAIREMRFGLFKRLIL